MVSRMTCHHQPVVRECYCGLRYQYCPICEPYMDRCLACQEEPRPKQYEKQERVKETIIVEQIIIAEPKSKTIDPCRYAKAYYRRHREQILEKSRRHRMESMG